MIDVWLFLTMLWVCLQAVIVVISYHTHVKFTPTHILCVFCHSITLFKCNEGPIPNQITQPFISERSMTKALLKMSLKKNFAYKKYTPKSLFFLPKVHFSIS